MADQSGAPISDAVRKFIANMPKTELHLHLEGTFEAPLAFTIAKRNGIGPGSPEFPWKTVQDLEKAYNFSDLASFLDVYNKVAKVLRTEQDFHDLAAAYCDKAMSENVKHCEAFFDPQTHSARGIPFNVVVNGMNHAFAEARAKGFSIRLIGSILRDHPVGTPEDPGDPSEGFSGTKTATGWATVKQMVAFNETATGDDQIIGIGLDDNENGFPPSLFVSIYDYARSHGLLATAHAGEEGPPSFVWEAIQELKCARIDHAVRSIEDRKLVAFMGTPNSTPSVVHAYGVAQRIPATVCPLSNYKLQVFPDPSKTNIIEMLDTGIQATVNADDPAYFGGYATENYLFLLKYLAPGVAKARPIDLADVYRLCVNGFESSWIDRSRVESYLAEVNAYFNVEPGLLYSDIVTGLSGS